MVFATRSWSNMAACFLLRFSTFPSGIENRGFTQIEKFLRRKTPQNATSHFEKETLSVIRLTRSLNIE